MMRSQTVRLSVVLAVAASGAVGMVARDRPPMPKITHPVVFDTPEADAILSAMQVFPPDNPWNQDISKLPVHADSARMIASIGAERSLGYNLDMGFVIVPADQKLYTWWSYRARDWALSNRGRRLDHIWSSANLSGRLAGIEVVRAARDWERPSDHVPVIARFDLD